MEIRRNYSAMEQEEALSRIVKEILCIDHVEATDDLFEMGLTSMGALSLIADAEQEGIKVDLVAIVEHRTVRGIVEALAQRPSEEIKKNYAISETRERKVTWPVPTGWLESDHPGDFHFCELHSFQAVDAQKLCDALNQAVANRSALSMIIEKDEAGKNHMRYDAAVTPHYEVQRLTEAEFEVKRADLIQPFEMYGTPLIHANVFETESSVYLFMDIHHIIMDGSAKVMLYDDIEKAYHGEPLEQDTYCTYLAQMEREKSTERYQAEKNRLLQHFSDENWRIGFTPDMNGGENNMAFLQCQRVVKRTELSGISERLGISEGLLTAGISLLTIARIEGEGNCICSSVFHNRSDEVRRNAFGKLVTVITSNAQIRKSSSVSEFCKELKTSWIESAEALPAVPEAILGSPRGIDMLQAIYQTIEANTRPLMTSLGAKQEDHQQLMSGGLINQGVLLCEYPEFIVPMLEINTTRFSPEKQAAILDAMGAVIDRLVAVENPETATLAELLD